MKYSKSAKDLAFDKERGKYRKKIKELEREVSSLQFSICQKDNELGILRSELMQKEDWIRRLLEYTELSEDEMKSIIAKEKGESEIIEMFQTMKSVFSSEYRM